MRVLLKDNDGQLKHDTILTKGALLHKICELIPKLPTRAENPDGITQEDEEEKVSKELTEDADEPTKPEPTSSAAASTASDSHKADKKNKKNKKKKNKW